MLRAPASNSTRLRRYSPEIAGIAILAEHLKIPYTVSVVLRGLFLGIANTKFFIGGQFTSAL